MYLLGPTLVHLPFPVFSGRGSMSGDQKAERVKKLAKAFSHRDETGVGEEVRRWLRGHT